MDSPDRAADPGGHWRGPGRLLRLFPEERPSYAYDIIDSRACLLCQQRAVELNREQCWHHRPGTGRVEQHCPSPGGHAALRLALEP